MGEGRDQRLGLQYPGTEFSQGLFKSNAAENSGVWGRDKTCHRSVVALRQRCSRAREQKADSKQKAQQ